MPATAFVDGPGGTALVGFADGTLGVWEAATGRRLHAQRLHGAVRAIARAGGIVEAETDLGDGANLDLRALDMPYCDLVRAVWREDAVRWQDERGVVRAAIPGDHPCAR